MRRLLVTGGAGFIGSHFVEHVLSRSLVDRVVVLDALTYAGSESNLQAVLSDPRLRFVKGDICRGRVVEDVLRDEQLDGVVNFAAETSVDRSIADPGIFQKTNIEGTVALLEACRRVWCAGSGIEHRFHQISTDEVFGPAPAPEGLRNETEPYAPRSPYAATKAAADHLVWAWRHTFGIQSSISYSSNVFGPRQQEEKLIPLAISKLLAARSIPVYGDGSHRRSWIFVKDVCRALEVFLGSRTEGMCLYLGSQTELSNLELLRELLELMGCSEGESIHFVSDRPGHDRRYGLSSSAFTQLTGFRESTGMRAGLVETINWHRERCATGPSPSLR